MSIVASSSRISVQTTSVRLRPITADEEEEWNVLMENVHPLGNAQFAGYRIKYVAEDRGHAVALLCVSGSSYHLADRDRWIGWSQEQIMQRRNFIVQNSRFLILPVSNRHNLASRVLSLCVKRVPLDWKKRFGFAPVLMETFVDPAHSKGTCYRAAGWTKVGQTRGFRRDGREFYTEDSSPKDIWMKQLCPDARKLMRSEKLSDSLRIFEKELPKKRVADRLRCDNLSSLYVTLKSIDDFRRRQGRRYPLAGCLSIVVCATLAGCKGVRESAEFGMSLTQKQLRSLRMWKNPKTGKYQSPAYTTLFRTVSGVDADQLEQRVNQWFKDRNLDPKAIAIDGKVLRATLENQDGGICATSGVSHADSPFFLIRNSHIQKDRKCRPRKK